MGMFLYKANIFPGQRINMLAGVSVESNSVFNQKLCDGFNAPVESLFSHYEPDSCFFGPFPVIVPCDNWTALVGAFFERFTMDGRPSSFAAAAALQGHSPEAKTIHTAVARRLGVKLEDANNQSNLSFVLVRVPRYLPENTVSLSAAKHRSLWDEVQSDCRGMIGSLKNRLKPIHSRERSSLDEAKIILDSIENELGSHVVESISIGDEVFQIFVYEKEPYKLICKSMETSGWNYAQALSFRYFTSPNFLHYCSSPALYSNDPLFSEIIPLLADKEYGVEASIFKLILNDAAQKKCKSITSLTCVAASCVSVVMDKAARLPNTEINSIEPTPVIEEVQIDIIAAQGAIARFGVDGCGPAMISGDRSIPYESIYKPFTANTPLSMLWSPYASLIQPYVRLEEFWNSVSVNKSAVKHLCIFADVIELQGSIDLSTLDSVTLICRLLIAGEHGFVPVVQLSTSAWNPLQLYCGEMSGTCVFEASENPIFHRVVYDADALSLKPDRMQVAFDDSFGGKYPVAQFYDSSLADIQWRRATIQAGIETLLLTVSAVLRPQAIVSPALGQTVLEAWKCLNWISDYLRKMVDSFSKDGRPVSEEIASLYSLSVTLLRVSWNPQTPASEWIPQVPSLRYKAYQDAVGRLLDQAKTYADQIAQANQALVQYEIEVQRNFRENQRDLSIREMAKFMVDQNEAFAKREDDLVKSHDDIINKNNESILILTQRETQIKAQYDDFLVKLNEAKDELTDAIEKKKRELEAKMAIDFAFGLVEAFGGVMTGVYSFKGLGGAEGVEKTLKKWEVFLKFAEVVNKLSEASEKLAENIDSVNGLSDSTPKTFAEPPTDTDWDIFMNDSEAQVRPAEDFVKPEVESFIATVRNLTVVAKSLNEVFRQKSQIQFNNFTEESLRKVSKQQSVRLRALELNLQNSSASPCLDYVADIGQLAAMLQQRQNSVLNRLAEIAMLQNDSMTYDYLSKPSRITRFDLASIQENLAAQSLSAVQMLSTYPYPPTDAQQPVEVKVECVAIAELMSDAGVAIDVSPTLGLFNSMARVRINSVDVRIDGVATDKGKCHVQMISTGMPMSDRGLKRENLTYKMISREWHVVYDIASDKTIIGTQPAKEWDKLFTKSTPFQTWRVMLPNTPENFGLKFNSLTTKVTLSFNVEMMYSTPHALQVNEAIGSQLLAVTENDTDPAAFINLLKGASVTDGWDVVSFVSVKKINALWEQRWHAESDGAFKGDPMFVQKIDISHNLTVPGDITVVYRLISKAGPPRLTFVADSRQSALVDIPLIDGSLTTTTYQKGEKIAETTTSIESSSETPVMVKTKAALQALPGNVDKFHTVYINPAEGVFAFENIELAPQVDAAFCSEISEYFKNQKLPAWLIGSLRFQAEQSYLQPTSFNFQTYTPPETRQHDWPSILGIYILTTTENKPVHGMRQSWPDAAWPVSEEFDAAVYFSADLLWNNEVAPALKATLGNAEVTLDQNTHEYSARGTGSMQVYDKEVSLLDGWSSAAHRVTTHAKVAFPNSALSLKFNLTSLILACDTNWNEPFPYQGRVVSPAAGDFSYQVRYVDVKFSCQFNSESKPHIDKDNFNVTFDPLRISTTATVDSYSPYGPSSVDDNAAAAKVALVEKFSTLKVELGAMSMFAVSNLLFPESKAIDPCGIYFPRDMVIVGKVNREWVPPKQ